MFSNQKQSIFKLDETSLWEVPTVDNVKLRESVYKCVCVHAYVYALCKQ